MKKLNKKGFTIVELVIVIGVIGILSAILIPTFVNLTKQANETKIQANLRNAYSAYIAQAADGVLDDGTTKIEIVGEAEVVLKDGDNYYTWNVTEKVWEKENSTPTKSGYVLTNVSADVNDSTYNGVLVQYFEEE